MSGHGSLEGLEGSELSGAFWLRQESLGVSRSHSKIIQNLCSKLRYSAALADMLYRELHDSIDLCGTASLAAGSIRKENWRILLTGLPPSERPSAWGQGGIRVFFHVFSASAP